MTRHTSARGVPGLAEKWLLAAAQDADRARAEWQDHGVALLRCGVSFTAVRVPAAAVAAAVGSDAAEDVAAHLAHLGGAVFAVPRYAYFYALTAVGQAACRRAPGTEVLAPGTYIGIPALDRIGPAEDFEAYWVVPPDGPGTLCTPAALVSLLARGDAISGAWEGDRA